MKNIKNIILLLILSVCSSFLVVCCKSKSEKDFQKIQNYFEKKHNHKMNSSVNKLVVISEGKGCGTCDDRFAQTALKYLADSSVFLITSKGNVVDIQPFIDQMDNCFFDWQLDLSKFPEFYSSRVFYFKDNKIDTVIVINSNEIIQQLEYFRLDK